MERKHLEILLEDIRAQVKLIAEGHQVLDSRINETNQNVQELRQEVHCFREDISQFNAKILELLEKHGNQLQDHEVRIKTLEKV